MFVFFIFFSPNTLGHPDNYVYADSLSTPLHIVPEWYFLPFYAILRSIPSKAGGVSLMGLSIIVLFLLPYIYKPVVKGSPFSPTYKFFFWIFVANVIFLGWLGQKGIEYPYTTLGVISTCIYFGYFAILLLCNTLFDHEIAR
jgi:ubiquinol-cytochrome c reductase cytochrome b subunit